MFRGKIIALSMLMFKIKYSVKQSNIKICIRKERGYEMKDLKFQLEKLKIENIITKASRKK